jgi:release factor glutamine methyltransferase
MTKSLKSIYDDALKLVDDKNVFYRDILFLMKDVFCVSESDIICYGDKEVETSDFHEKLTRLANGEPVEYIVGHAPFYGNEFKVSKDTLIPRNETEELVEHLLRKIKEKGMTKPSLIDIGSGSGCIGITLSLKLTDSNVDSVDISKDALLIAKENNKALNAHVNFYLGDCLLEARENNQKYDVIVSNPPYIDPETYVQDSVLKYEPHLALFADNHGLAIYQKIFKDANYVLNDNFIMGFEISPDLKEGLIALVKTYFPDAEYEFIEDMNGFIRFLFVSSKK